jgi:pyrroloquinoline quinone biosynthesis protein B
MIIKILGSAAGGGFPQWNCNCPNCRDVRLSRDGLKPRTQSSLAVSADGANWVLLNASPDLRQQILATRELGPRSDGLRDSPIEAVVLTNGDVDHVAGLICLREGHRFQLFGTERVLATLAANPVFGVLDPETVRRTLLELDKPTAIGSSGLVVEAFAVPGKIALYMENAAAGADFGTAEGDTVGLCISAGDKQALYIPGCAGLDDALSARLQGARLVFFDGTLYDDNEMIRLGLSTKTGKRMGHMSMAGEAGSLAQLAKFDISRKIFVHLNNSNPTLRETSREHDKVRAAGWEIGFDGMEVQL